MKTSIREASVDQMDAILYLVNKSTQEYYPGQPFSASAAEGYTCTVLKLPEMYAGWIAYKDDKPVGFAHATLERMMFNTNMMTRLEFLYVVPEFRGSFVMVRLLE